MGFGGSICPLIVEEESPTEWRLPEFREDFLEEAVPEAWEGVGFRARTTGGTVLWLQARHGGLNTNTE